MDIFLKMDFEKFDGLSIIVDQNLKGDCPDNFLDIKFFFYFSRKVDKRQIIFLTIIVP